MQDLYQKFTSHLKEALLRAYLLARRDQENEVAPEHLFMSLASQQGSLASELLHKRGIREEVSVTFRELPNIDPIDLKLNLESKEIIQKMVSLAFEYQHHYVGTEHLLAALIQEPGANIKNLLIDRQLNQRELVKELEQVLVSSSHFSDLTSLFTDFSTANKELKIGRREASRAGSLVEAFGIDLTNQEVQQDIDPVIGRENEIERLIQILSRRHKNNPLLIGDPGVGKTAIVEGLAKRIMLGTIPPVLQGKRIIALDLSLIVAGTMYRGEFESRLKTIIDELQSTKDTIIFIDEVHTIIGAGSSTGGTLDAANILKPALARGDLRCIGATTLSEYRKTIESDPALDRRFQAIIVREPTSQETLQVLEGIKQNYEKYHQVTISPAALQAAVDLSVRYLPDKHLPDKAIDLIDEAAAAARLKQAQTNDQAKVRKLEQKIAQLENDKEELVRKERFDDAWRLKVKQREYEKKLQQWQANLRRTLPTVTITAELIATVVAQITNIPVDHISQTTGQRLEKLNEKLQKRIIGQDEAINIISNSIRRAQVGLAKPLRPLGSFMFLGPSGVGKTALAKVLASEVFGTEAALIRMDMSEYSEKFNISKLIGAPAGYVGYKESGLLTEKVRRRPYAVVLFDEIEKAHPEVFNILLQILDEGFITDAVGDKINFRQTVIILTCNLGAEEFNLHAKLGFTGDFTSQVKDQVQVFAQLKEKMLRQLQDNFRPEFLNRLDKILVFNPLTSQDLVKIVEIELNDLRQRLAQQDITIKVPISVKRQIARWGFSPHQGAREISRQVQELVEQPLIAKLITQEISPGDNLQLSLQHGKIVFAKAK